MPERKDDIPLDRILAVLERHWKPLVIFAWLLFCGWFVYSRWSGIHAFALGDTDDNMRMMQVRALLHGQDWYDLRQYRLNPPFGADIHWSRLPDLPIAALILLLKPFLGGADAERIAVSIAPMIPFALLLYGVALTARRLIDPRAFFLPLVAMTVAGIATGMFMPLRIDHHGWQLAFLALGVAGLVDPRKARGGLTLGVCSALSIAIGLEMIIYLAIAGAAVALFWVIDPDERRRAIAYSASLGGGVALSFLIFASNANRFAVCDALSPVWLSNLLLAAAFLLAIAWVSPADWKARLGLCAVAGIAIAGFHALAWPQCLNRLEGVSTEVYDLWLSKVREARPVYRHGWKIASLIVALPVTGAIGWALLAWRNRADPDLLRRTAAAALLAIIAAILLLWQTRTGPAAQMLAAVGSVAIVWVLAPVFDRSAKPILRTLGIVVIAIVGFGAAVPLALKLVPDKKATEREAKINRSNRLCNFIGSFRPVAAQPKGVVFTFVDIAPRLITVTHHDSIIGPYHRNGEQIVDVMKAFRGSEAQARAIFAKYGADYLLTCPNSSTTTIFLSEAPKGFYAQLSKGDVPDWLTPVEMPEKSPFRMWRIEQPPGR